MRKLTITPGVDVERTPTLGEGGINTSQLIRHFAGLPQKYGGWQQLPGIDPLIGTCTGLFGWADLLGNAYLAAGTDQRLFVVSGGQLSDITPVYASDALTAAFETTINSPNVIITDAAVTPSVGDWIDITTSVSVGGLTLLGFYQINGVVSPTQYQIDAGADATSTAGPSGDATVKYLLPSGYAVNTPLGGFGVGDYGDGDWGLANSLVSTGAVRQWSLDQWGADLIASPTNGGIYYWAPPTIAPAVVVDSSAPTMNISVFVMGQVQIIIAAGAEMMSTLYPTLIRWCNSGDFTDWTASATNQAGSYQLATGSTVVATKSTGLGALIWTDTDLWSMAYQGLPFVFGFNRIGVNCEAISQRAPVVVGNSVVWPSIRGFFRYDGSQVAPMPCTVWDFFFDNVDMSQLGLISGGRNTLFNEVAWHVPAIGGGFFRVKWNYLENLWDYDPIGAIERTAWVDHSPVGNPMGTDTAGLIQQHEVGNDANGQALVWQFTTGYYDLGDGTEYAFVDFVVPDFLGNWSAIQITVYAVDFPTQEPRVYGPFTVTQSGTPYFNCRVRGRQIAFGIGGSDMGSFVRLGAIRVRFAQDGRR